MLLANQPHISLRRRRVDHKRSKRGCLTCRVRRKKCPEDFQSWPDGTSACSACYMRGQVCRVPASVAATKLKANSSMRGGLVSSPTVQHTSPIRTSENGQSVPSPANVSNVAQELPNSSSKGPQIPQVYESSHNWRSGETTINSQAGIGPFSQPSWLDTFFDEFMNLTGPVMEQHTQCDDTSETSMVETLADSVSLFSTSSATPVSDNHHALPASRHSVREILNPASKGTHSFHQPKSVLPWSDSIIDQTIRSDDLDELLVRWSPIYETYLCAIADVSTPTGHEPSLLGQLMDVTKSNTMCKASMVACCLAYRDVMLRELQSAKAPSRFVRYLVHGRRRPEEDLFDSERTQDLSYASNSTNTSQFAHAWLRFALEGYRRQRTTMSISPRLLTLLNVRCAAVCILGASDSNKLAPDIAQELSDLEVSVEYLQSTSSSGTMLAFLVSALASANIMDTATIRGARTAIKDTGINVESPSYAPATILKQDLEINPTTVYRYVSSLSMTLLLCMRQISELAADIESGSCLLKSDVEERSTDIQQKIVSSHLDLPADVEAGISRLRAFALHEMWRQAVLLQLYQDVHRLGPMACRVRSALNQILRLADIVATAENTTSDDQAYTSPHIDVWDMSMVWFLACTVAITDEHRAICLRNLETLGCERAIMDNINAVKVLWRSIDETGRAMDWRTVLSDNNLTVSYTF